MLTGRDISVHQRLVEVCLRLLADHVGSQVPPGSCQLSVEVREMDRSTYGKSRPRELICRGGGAASQPGAAAFSPSPGACVDPAAAVHHQHRAVDKLRGVSLAR